MRGGGCNLFYFSSIHVSEGYRIKRGGGEGIVWLVWAGGCCLFCFCFLFCFACVCMCLVFVFFLGGGEGGCCYLF